MEFFLNIFSKKRVEGTGSLSRIAWLRFLRNGLSMTALGYIVFCLFIAILGYLITPDHAPYANSQHLELATQKPGFAVSMLKVRKNESLKPVGFLERMLFGSFSPYSYYPISYHRFENGMIIVHEFSDDQLTEPIERQFSLADVVFPLARANPSLLGGDSMEITLLDGKVMSASVEKLKQEVTDHHVVRKHYLLGTDQFGRDLLSRLMIGTRVSLSVGFISVFISLVIGIFIGSLGGFFRGRVDAFVMWLINVVWSIPTLLLVIAITFALGKGFWQVFVAVGLTMWVEVARVTRGQILSLREKEFIEAGRALGFPPMRIIVNHILPNILGPVIVIAAANFASAILIEAGLSFLGIGVQPPMPSWGSMIKENYGYIILDAAYLAILPGLAIMLLVLAFMIVGNGIRDALDVRIVKK